MKQVVNAKPLMCAILIAFALAFPQAITAATDARPAFQVDVPNPTKDKPQSKLWFARGAWWAWLPVMGGSSVWKRTDGGWQRQTHLDAALKGLPGQADVWAGQDTATAVLVEPDRLAVVALQWQQATQRYELAAPPAILQAPPHQGKEGGIETATIARDGQGRWWIAYNWRQIMYVRYTTNSTVREWSEPIAVSTLKVASDDICMIVALPGSIAVVWSDQDQDAIYFRQHKDAAPPETWKPIETAASGGKTADDHLNAAVAEDGTLYIATKNSVDQVDQPQLVLRIRHPHGTWDNLPYAPRTSAGEPSRPIVLLESGSRRIILIHSLYGKDGALPRRNGIAWLTADRHRIELSPAATTLLEAATRLNNATGPKAHLPAAQPWIVLVSDEYGSVFEAQLHGRD